MNAENECICGKSKGKKPMYPNICGICDGWF